jgi:hypothetical protein
VRHNLPGGQIRWHRLAGWCTLARPPCLQLAEGEETVLDLGRAPPAEVGEGQQLDWIRRRCALPIGEEAGIRGRGGGRWGGGARRAQPGRRPWPRVRVGAGFERGSEEEATNGCGRERVRRPSRTDRT